MASSDDQNVLTHTKKLGNSQFQVFCKSHAETAHLIFSIQKYLRKTPSFYYSSILTINKGRSIENIQKRLKQEFNLLTHEKSFYHIISRSMSSRQKCIQKIRRELTKAERVLTMFKKQYIHDDDYKNLAYMEYVQQQGYSQLQVDETIQNTISIISNIFVDISRLRDMTIYVVETVHKWKVQIEEWADKCSQYEPVFFIHQEQNVYDIILEDTSFIWQSTLGQYIYIVYKNDPFLVRNVIQVQERSTKTILQKYFVQILYPKSQEIVSKSIKCLQMVTFKYEPQTQNIYREEQLLIQNYLSLHRQRQEEEGIEQISQNQHQWQDKVKKQRKDKLDSKGWIFGKNLKKPNSQRVKQIIERHQHKITFIKPFNITNFAQKNSLALAYIGRSKQRESPVPLRKVSQDKKDKQIQKIYRTQSIFRVKKSSSSNKLQSPIQKGYNSQNQVSKKLASMYQSLTKLSPIIIQDPQEHSDQTPKFKKREIHNIIQNGILTEPEPETKTFDKSSRFNPTIKLNEVRQKKNYDKFNGVTPISSESTPKLKLNSCEFNGNSELVQNSQLVGNGELIQNREAINNLQDEKKQIIVADSRQNNLLQNKSPVQKQRSLDKIQVESEQKQIDFGKFIETFRANTNKPKVVLEKQNAKTELRKKKIEENRKKLMSVRELIESNKTNNQTISPHKKSIINLQGRPTPIPNFRSIPRSNYHDPLVIGSPGIQKSFSQYKQIKASRESSAKQPFRFQDDFIILQSKSIPFDIIPIYLRHIFTQIHSTSKKFTLYSYESLLSKLQDPYTHCIVFDVLTQKRGPIGQVILSENLGMNNKKLKYSIQFINIHVFQLVVAAILRIAQELLYATPCEQVICPLMQDRLDPVSTHFVSLIQNAFKSRVSSFGALTILQKQKVYYKQSDLYERLNIFYSNNKKIQQLKMAKTMMGNYRALKFQCRCLMLSSNFRMKTKSKNVVSNYQTASIGYLYRKIMEKIVTKNHLRQMKVASVNPNQNDETASLLKHNSFLRTLITSLAGYIKEQAYTQEDYIHITRFQNMSQVLTYLDYKQYSQYFHFSFLEESRFILNHELFISEFQMQVSLQFMVRSSIDFLILYNHHNLPVKIIEPNLNTKAKALIMPTTHEQIDLILIDGSQFEQETTDKLDLFSYLYIYQLSNLKFFKELQNVKEIVIPAIHKTIHDVNSVKMFDGLFRLFPEKEFYSGTYFSCKNMWQSYFPSAVIYKPELNSIVFEYPLIVGFLHKKRNQILTAFLLKNPHE